jgi:uncharacterized protein (TIGR03437 family)
LWTRDFTDAGTDLASAVADTTGVYVGGYIRAQPGEIASQFVRKYDADGNEAWTRQLEFRPLVGLAADATGIYVAGARFTPRRESFLRKYNSDGVELWTTQFPEQLFGVMTVDSTGVYIIGSGLVRKWDLRGSELWSRPANINWTMVLIAAAAPSGFFVISDADRTPTLRRYDSAGNELWARPLATSYSVYPGGMAVDAMGIYIAGTTDMASPALPGQCRSGSGVDSFVRKYDPDGEELWTREFSTSDAAWAGGVTVDASGVYVVGTFGSAVDESLYSMPPPPRGTFLAKFENSAVEAPGLRPRIFPDCVLNAASGVGGGVAPGEIVTIFGSAMGPVEAVRQSPADDRRLETIHADTRVLFNGVAAPLLSVSDKQTTAIVPYAMAGRSSVDVQVEYKGVRSDAVTVPVLASRPGIFSVDGSGYGQAAIRNEDGSVNSPSNPARKGSVITIFATGGGEAAAGVADGQVIRGVLPTIRLPVSVVFDYLLDDEFGNGPKPTEVLYAGGSPGSVAGLLQVNVRVPANVMVTGDAVPFALIIGSHWAGLQATMAVR